MNEDSLTKRISELSKRAEFTYQKQFTDFLTLSEINSAKSVLNGKNYSFFGGCEDNERQMLCIAPKEDEILNSEFPITGILVLPKNEKFSEELNHRDVLGSILGLSLDRSILGDIFLEEKKAFFFCEETISDFIIDNLVKIRHTLVTCRKEEMNTSLFQKKYLEKTCTVTSLRLDVLVCAAFSVSRGKCASDFPGGHIFLNGREEFSQSVLVKEQDVISYRGHGKIRLKEIGGLTRKERIFITLEQYQ